MNTINDKILILDIYKSKCSDCKYFNWDNCTCKAFEDIPSEYLSGEKIHDKVVEGQKGNFVFTEEK